MATQEVPHADWVSFLNQFSKDHEGKLASLQEFGPATGDHQEARKLPFAGISIESHHGDKGTIAIMLGTDPSDHITHAITAPTHVWLKSGEDEPDEVIEIKSEDGITAILRFA